MTRQTTANASFEANYRALRKFIEQSTATTTLPANRGPIHLRWSTAGFHYKFIEHMVLRMRRGELPPSHGERLSLLNATWGSKQLPLSHIFWLDEMAVLTKRRFMQP